MRKNQSNVLNAHFAGKSCNEKTISTDGRTIKSYATPLLWTDKVTKRVTLNVTNYSRTTSSQQAAIRGELVDRGIVFDTVDNKPRGFYVD